MESSYDGSCYCLIWLLPTHPHVWQKNAESKTKYLEDLCVWSLFVWDILGLIALVCQCLLWSGLAENKFRLRITKKTNLMMIHHAKLCQIWNQIMGWSHHSRLLWRFNFLTKWLRQVVTSEQMHWQKQIDSAKSKTT